MSAAPEASVWLWWQMALKGHRQSVVMGEPQQGYWRRKFKATKTRPGSDDPVATWKSPDGVWSALVGIGVEARRISGQDEVYGIFESCCKTPISYEHYQHVQKHRVWPADLPDDVQEKATAALQDKPATDERGTGDNSEKADAPSKHELAVDAVTTAKKAFDEWLATIGGKILTQEQADLAAEYRDRATKLEARADEVRKDEKEPHLLAGRAVDDKWRDVIADAAALKVTVRDAIGEFLKAEKKRMQDEAAAAAKKAAEERAAAAAAAAAERGEDPPQQAPAPAPVAPTVPTTAVRAGGAGTRKTGLKSVKRVRILDMSAVKQAFIQTPAGEFAAKDWAEKNGPSSAIPIPGTEVYEEDVAR